MTKKPHSNRLNTIFIYFYMTKHSNRLNIKRVGSTPAAYPHLMSASPTMSYVIRERPRVHIVSGNVENETVHRSDKY